MFVKKKIHLILFLLAGVQIYLSLIFEKSSLGQVWFNINPNSLVGFQNVLERFTNLHYSSAILLLILETNFFFILSFIPIIISFLVFILYD